MTAVLRQWRKDNEGNYYGNIYADISSMRRPNGERTVIQKCIISHVLEEADNWLVRTGVHTYLLPKDEELTE